MWEDTDRGRGVVIQMWMTQNALLLVIVSDLEPGTSRMWEDTDRGRGVVIQMWMTQNALLLVIVSDLEVIHHCTGL
ncbi:hypothetical protein J6590_052163 [Homalodisca vitripennis]|nr:hypothetical protein J6590_052163 [Homalodisca vitripennis]